MLNQFTHERFVEFLQQATLADIQAMAPENLPEGVQLDVLFEAPMELSDSVRALVLKAQALQSQNKEGAILKTLGKQGEDILACANAPSPSAVQQTFRKQQKAAEDLQKKLTLKQDPIAQKILNKLLTQIAHGASQIQSEKNQVEQHLSEIKAILQDESHHQLHSSAEHIEEKLKHKLKNLTIDLQSFGKAQEAVATDQTQQLLKAIQDIHTNAIELQSKMPVKPKKKNKPAKIDVELAQSILSAVESIKQISHSNLITTLSNSLSELGIDPDTQDPAVNNRLNKAFQLVQWYCCANEAVIHLEDQACVTEDSANTVKDQIVKQQDILNSLQKTLSSINHWQLSAIQAKQAWTTQLKQTHA